MTCVPCPVCLSGYTAVGIFIILLFKNFKIQILTVLEQRAKVMGKMEQARLARQAKKLLKSKKGSN